MPIQYLVRLLNLVNFTSKSHATVAMAGVRVNQRIRFLPNVFCFLLPARLQWVEPAGGGSGKRKTFG